MAKLKFNPEGYQDLGAYALLKNVVENQHLVAEDSRPYKVYSALINQSNMDAPTADTILENTIGTVTWSYLSEGVYQATFPINIDFSTFFIQPTLNNSPDNVGYYLRANSHISFELTTLVSGYGPSDNWLVNTPIEIKVYK